MDYIQVFEIHMPPLGRSWFHNLKQTNNVTGWKIQTTPHKDDKQNDVTLRRRNQEKNIYVKVTSLNKSEGEKWFNVWF